MVLFEQSFYVTRILLKHMVIPSVLKNSIHYSNFICISKFQYRYSTLQNSCNLLKNDSKENPDNYLTFSDCHDNKSKELIKSDMVVINDFLHESEEQSLFEELEPYMKRLRYEFDHWDNAIHGYRETERLKWNEQNTKIINRVRDLAFPSASKTLTLVHVLDLAEDGFIKPHIDSVRFCGNVIAGLSLLSDSVMRLVHDKEKEKTVDILLKRRSLYIMRDCARYDYTHEILQNELSVFKTTPIKKTRRISVICRNEPNDESKNMK